KERNIPFVVKGGGKLFEQEEVVLITKAFSFVADCSYEGEVVTVDDLKQLYLQTFREYGDVEKFIGQLVDFKATTEMNEFISLQGVFQQFLGFMGGMDFEFSETQLYNLGMFSQAITDFEAIYKRIKLRQMKYFLGFVHAYAKWNYEEGGSDDPTKINAVKIMTVHRSKGLQFPIVFVPHLQQGLFPSKSKARNWLIPEHLFNKERYEGKLEDERRLFYVAITRSEKYLYLTCHQMNNLTGRKSSPSRFFAEYPRHYALTQPIADPTEREKMDLKTAAPLRRFATSYSDLRYYDYCPYDYKLRFIYGFNPEIAIALGYGKSIHNILNVIHNDYRINPPDEETVQKIIDSHFFLRYCSPELNTRFKNSAKNIIYNYVKNYSGEFNLILETEKAFEFALDQTLISGQIDLIKMLNEKGELEAIEIVDFKEHESSELSTDYIKQLRLYAIASIRSLGFHPQQAAVHHLDEGTRSMVDISQDALVKMEDTIKETVDSIISREFPKLPAHKKCLACDWRYFCTKK
ncbi:MAG: 3'-5' exonuclease, partial [Candidatus Thorarchaeota archaeon]